MKKPFALFFSITFLLGFFLLLPRLTYAGSTIAGVTGVPTVTQALIGTGATITGSTVTVAGKLSTAGMDDYNNTIFDLSGYYMAIDYGQVADQSEVTQTSPINVANGVTNPNGTHCTVVNDKNSPNYETFTCTFSVTANGTYVYAVGSDGLTDTLYSNENKTVNEEFNVTGITTGAPANNATYNLNNVTVTNNTGMALVTVGISATGTASGTSYLIELGNAIPPTSGTIYTCSETNPRTLSGPVNASSFQANFNLTVPGTYCVQLRQLASLTDTLGTPVATVSGGTSYFQNSVGAAVNGIFPVLGATVNSNATLNQSANSLGCSTPATSNTGYCLLAPLPGVGNATTGYLDVSTGLGSYINAIIKLVMGLIGVLAVLMIVVGGIEYMATVSITEKEGAKNRIINALLGLLVALGSYIILNTINPNLTNLTVTVNPVAISYTPTADIGLPIPSGTPPMTNGTSSGTATGTSDVKSNNTTYDTVLQNAANAYGVDCTWLKATMYRESNGNPGATSKAGAIGLMQMMPGTWNSMGFTDSTKWSDPQTAANAAAKFISGLKTTGCNGSPSSSTTDCNVTNNNYVNGFLAAAYNAGAGSNAPAKDCTGQTQWECQINQGGYVETEQYATLVTNNYQALKQNTWGC